MPAAKPAARPQLAEAAARALCAQHGLDLEADPIAVLGVRTYYPDSIGKPGQDDRGAYDDALMLFTPGGYRTFNANTDPTRWRKGRGFGATKGMASLNPGLWRVHRLDLHKGQYLALCQRAGSVTVTRDGDPPYPETGGFGINIHRGGNNTTSSEGCQTIPPDQWGEFIGAVERSARARWGAEWNRRIIPYLLVQGPLP